MAVYMKLEGIEGDITAEGYVGWCEVNYTHFAIQQRANMTIGHGINKMSSIPKLRLYKIR